MCDLPAEIAPSEKIVRAVIFPYHFDKKKQKYTHRAFRPAPGTDRLSVIRQTHMGSDFCKAKGREIAAGGGENKRYTGLAVLTAEQIRSVGIGLEDAREDYCGHAHIRFGIVVERNEPPDSTTNKRLTELTQSVFKLAVYREDPAPDATMWTGPEL